MANELTIMGPGPGDVPMISPDDIYALREFNTVAGVLMANIPKGEGLDLSSLITIKTPSQGVTTWSWEGASGLKSADTIDGMLVYVGRQGTLWPSEDIGSARPILQTFDMRTAIKVGDDLGDIDEDILEQARNEDGTYDWIGTDEGGTNFYNSWGSSEKSGGKRCTETRNLGILRRDDRLPVIVRVGKGAIYEKKGSPHMGLRKWLHQLPVYTWQSMVSLSLVATAGPRDIMYSRILATHIGSIPIEDGKKLRDTYEGPIRIAIEGGAAAPVRE